jgi:hypothetical protein
MEIVLQIKQEIEIDAKRCIDYRQEEEDKIKK